MSIETIQFRGCAYPRFQATGNAMRFAMPFAVEVLANCRNVLDIGFGEEAWMFPGATGIDLKSGGEHHAMNLPEGEWDGIVSSHLLEHLPDWVGALDYWTRKLQPGGVLFLYLPHPHQKYWLPFNNRKHVSSLRPKLIRQYLEQSGEYQNIFVSKRDANDSFTAFAERHPA